MCKLIKRISQKWEVLFTNPSKEKDDKYFHFQMFNSHLLFCFYLTLYCLVSTKRSHILKQTCSFQWTPDTKVLSQVVEYSSNYRGYFFASKYIPVKGWLIRWRYFYFSIKSWRFYVRIFLFPIDICQFFIWFHLRIIYRAEGSRMSNEVL